MSSLSEYSRFSGNLPAKSPPEKSSFTQTCSLLSQYLRENGAFPDLNLGMTCTVETNGFPETSCHSATTTMELFPTALTQRSPTAMNFLSIQNPYPRQSEASPMAKPSAFRCIEKKAKADQLTIFYAGQVIVFDDFPPEKVEEIISLANKGIFQSQNSSAYAHTHNQQRNHPSFVPQPPSRPIVCDLPIARKVSLHRFLEKRKDRIASKAPYQTKNPNSASHKPPTESMSWLGLGAQPTQI